MIIAVPTEIFSRVAGFYRPVSSWNKGKQEEFRDRKALKFDKEDVQENIKKD